MANLEDPTDMPSRPPPPLPASLVPRAGISPRDTPPALRRHITDPLPMRPVSDIVSSSPPPSRRVVSIKRNVISHPSMPSSLNLKEFERITNDLPCFHPNIKKGEAEKYLRSPSISPGAYLLRKSERKEGCITISLLHLQNNLKQIFHINIGHDQVGYYLSHDAYFETVPELLNYYRKEHIPGDQVRDLLLLSPIYRDDVDPSEASLYVNSPTLEKKFPRTRSQSQSAMPAPDEFKELPRHARHSSLRSRPQQPIPTDVESRHYDTPQDVGMSRLPRLIPRLKLIDEKQATARVRAKCSCGLFVEDAELVDGWIMHIDINPGPTQGKVFFAIEGGGEYDITSWALPKNIEEKLRTDYPKKWAIVQKCMSEKS